jgi:hypothetical protein
MKQKIIEQCLLAIGRLQAVIGELHRPDFEGCAILETLGMARASIDRAEDAYRTDDE